MDQTTASSTNSAAPEAACVAHSWPWFLRNMKMNPASTKDTSTDCHSCKYAIKVKNKTKTFEGHLREYIWKGGTYDMNSRAADGSLDPKAGKEWCFGYGEEEWLAGRTFTDVKNAALDRNPDTGAIQIPQGRVVCTN